MTNIGTVIDGKYEILKEIGRGGMSIVYLAMDKRLNKQWAVKEIRKRGNGKNDEIVVNSLLAEANLMKRLDHAALPRIVDIIDNGVTIYVVMDYIEGESLDKILAAEGPQPEDKVIEWAKQLCDALGYLHSQKKPIIYRDMKPANVMLKPEGNIKIIDFGIAREYKEQNLADTTVLGTKGYAPPEQYSGQTDPRSDIFALGMTMHHLLTGVDPRNGEPYAPVRQWNPDLSEGIEAIIDKCVQPAAENRYQNCSELLYDLEHPELIGRDWRRRQQKKVRRFGIVAGLAVLFAIVGVVCSLVATGINNSDYDRYLGDGMKPDDFYKAIEIYPERTKAYDRLIEYYKSLYIKKDETNEASYEEDIAERIKELKLLSNTITSANGTILNQDETDVADLNFKMGMLFISQREDLAFENRAKEAAPYFDLAVKSQSSFAKKEVARGFSDICNFFVAVTKTSSRVLSDYTVLFSQIETELDELDHLDKDDRDADYEKIVFYHVVCSLLFDQQNQLADFTDEETPPHKEAIRLLKDIYDRASVITPKGNDEVRRLKDLFLSKASAERISQYEAVFKAIESNSAKGGK